MNVVSAVAKEGFLVENSQELRAVGMLPRRLEIGARKRFEGRNIPSGRVPKASEFIDKKGEEQTPCYNFFVFIFMCVCMIMCV